MDLQKDNTWFASLGSFWLDWTDNCLYCWDFICFSFLFASLDLLAVLLWMQPRISSTLFTTRSHCWLMFKLVSIRNIQSLSVKLPFSQWAHRMYWTLSLLLPQVYSLQLLLAEFHQVPVCLFLHPVNSHVDGNLPRIQSAPSCRLWMKMLNRRGPSIGSWLFTWETLCHWSHLVGLAVQPVFTPPHSLINQPIHQQFLYECVTRQSVKSITEVLLPMLNLPESDEVWNPLGLSDKCYSLCSIYVVKYKSKIIIWAIAWDSHHDILTIISKLYLVLFFSYPVYMHLALVKAS